MATTADYGLGEQVFPRGWFMIAAAAELEGTKPLAVRFFGRDRVLYRERPDLQQAFPNPFASGRGSFQEWLEHEGA